MRHCTCLSRRFRNSHCKKIAADAFVCVCGMSMLEACFITPPQFLETRSPIVPGARLESNKPQKSFCPSQQSWDYRCMQLNCAQVFNVGFGDLSSSCLVQQMLCSLNHHLLSLVQVLLWRWRRCATDLLSRVPWAVWKMEGGFLGNEAFSSSAHNGKWNVGREWQQLIFSCPFLPSPRIL